VCHCGHVNSRNFLKPCQNRTNRLDSINRAIELGATGFEVHFSRAKLADAIGKKQAAISFAQEALRFAPPNSRPNEENRVNWLREITARNFDALTTLQEEERRRQVRAGRRERLPRIARWVFDFAEN
jgi:hypothetical protein